MTLASIQRRDKMLKRRYGNRQGWKRIAEHAQEFIESGTFTGYVTLLKMLKVTEPLFVQYGEDRLCIVDDGYCWLQHFPEDKKFSVTTMFNAEGDTIQWYIDICRQIGVDSDGVPWNDDLFLDIIVLSSGRIILKDEDELEAALSAGVIDIKEYEFAKSEAKRILTLIKEDSFDLLKLTNMHKDLLLAKINSQPSE